MKPKHADDGMHCPLWRKACVKVCHTCEFWAHIVGKHPQTNADVAHWSCAFRMQTMIALENTLAQRQTTASVDELRKEVRQANDVGMANALMGINVQARRVANAIEAGQAAPQHLIGAS